MTAMTAMTASAGPGPGPSPATEDAAVVDTSAAGPWDLGGVDTKGGRPWLEGIELTPYTSKLVIDITGGIPGPAQVVDFVATFQGADGTRRPISETCTFSVAAAGVGSFVGPRFTSVGHLPGGVPGLSTQVTAVCGAHSAWAQLDLVELRKTGSRRDLLFTIPYRGVPAPKDDVVDLVVADAASSISIRTTLDPAPVDPKLASVRASVRAMGEGSSSLGCVMVPTRDADRDGVQDTFVDAPAGAHLCFEVTPSRSETLEPRFETTYVRAWLDVMADGVSIDRRQLVVELPPPPPGGTP